MSDDASLPEITHEVLVAVLNEEKQGLSNELTMARATVLVLKRSLARSDAEVERLTVEVTKLLPDELFNGPLTDENGDDVAGVGRMIKDRPQA